MADFTLDGDIVAGSSLEGLARASCSMLGDIVASSTLGGVPRWGRYVRGEVTGNAAGNNNVRGRVVASIFTTGAIVGTGVVTGYVTRTISGLVSGVAVVAGQVRNTPRVFGEALGVGLIEGYPSATPRVSGGVLGSGSPLGNPSPAVHGSVLGVGTIAGLFDLDLVVTGEVSGVAVLGGAVAAPSPMSGEVTGTGVLAGTLRASSRVSGGVVAGQLLAGNIRIGAKITNRTVIGVAEVTGSLVRDRAASATAEGEYEETGVRPAFGLLVYELDATGPGSLGQVPDNERFLVSASYVGTPGDPFYEAGASANAIGQKVQPLFGASYYVFRQPRQNETVWYVPGEQTYRFQEDRDSTLLSWVKYRTMPHRSFDGMRLFDIFDPDGIYKYFAKALGFIQTALVYDNSVLLNQYDPDLASRFYLPELASNYGLTLNYDDELPVRRAKTRNAVPTYKQKGLDSGVRLRIRSLGLTGYANEIWVDPTDPGNFQSPATNENGSPTSSPTGAGTAYREYPHGYRADDPTDGLVPSSRVAVHLNDGSGNPLNITQALKERVARELGEDVLPAFVDIRYFATDVPVVDPEGVEVDDELEITAV